MDSTQIASSITSVSIAGAACFGLVVGWMAQRVFEVQRTPNVSWLVSMISVIGGGAVTSLFGSRTVMFSGYAVGLACAFFAATLFRPIGRTFKDFFEREEDDDPPNTDKRPNTST
jgi:hypothetical protein